MEVRLLQAARCLKAIMVQLEVTCGLVLFTVMQGYSLESSLQVIHLRLQNCSRLLPLNIWPSTWKETWADSSSFSRVLLCQGQH